MIEHDLVQGSPEWMAHRAQFFNASDAPAMMGCSPYKTRTQLLHELHTGLTPEVDAATQRRFDDGHRFEALARPLANAIIGLEVYPVVGSSGKFSASFDGLTMCETVAFEHKSLNAELRSVMQPHATGLDLPLQYRVQMEQQCMVSGAERVLFMASKWDGDTLIEERHCWYESDFALAADIDAGWEQFAADLAVYVPAEAETPAVPKIASSLPVVFDMRVEGKLVSCNLDLYKPAAMSYIAAINDDLATDQHFADATADAKYCRDSADKLELAIELALGQMGDINAALNTVREIAAAFDAKGLALEKLVDKRKAEIKEGIIKKAREAYAEHEKELIVSTGGPWIVLPPPDFAGAAKNKRTISSLQDAVDTVLASAKIAADASARRIRASLDCLKEDGAGFESLFADKLSLIGKPLDDLKLLIKSRIDEQKAKNQKLIDDAAAATKAAAELSTAKQSEGVELSPAAQALNEQEGAQRFATAHPATTRQVFGFPTRPAVAPKSPPTLKLGQIGERLGFSLTGDFLKNLGFEPAARDKAALLFHESDFPLICMRLVSHIQRVQSEKAA